MTVENSIAIFIQCINEFKYRKENNPYYACNYKKPLKAKQILQRL
jgi:hypothetical protein